MSRNAGRPLRILCGIIGLIAIAAAKPTNLRFFESAIAGRGALTVGTVFAIMSVTSFRPVLRAV